MCKRARGCKRWELKDENKDRNGGRKWSHVEKCSWPKGGDTNWGVGSVSLRGILIFLFSFIGETFTRSWQMSGMFVFLSNLHGSHAGEMFSVLTRKAGWREKEQELVGGILSIRLLYFKIWLHSVFFPLIKGRLELRRSSGSSTNRGVGAFIPNPGLQVSSGKILNPKLIPVAVLSAYK